MRIPASALLVTVVGLSGPTLPVQAAPLPAVPAAWIGEADRQVTAGFAQLESGHVDDAETAFRTALQLDPGQARAQAGLGIAMLRRGRHPEAAVHFRKAVAGSLPADFAARCYANLGMISDGEGQTEAAIRFVQRAYRLHPRAIHQALLARLYLGAHRLDEAQAAARAARALDPFDPGVLAVCGRVANAFGRYDEAITLLKHAIRLDQDNSEIFCDMGLAYLGQGKLDEAERWLIGSVELNDRRARTFDALAHVFLLQRKVGAAIQALEAKLRVDPDHRTAWQDLRAIETQVRSGADGSAQPRNP